MTPDHPLFRMGQQRQQRGEHEAAERKEGSRRIAKILEKIKFSELSAADKVKQIRAMTPDNFYQMLALLNGYLRDLPRNKYEDVAPYTGENAIRDLENEHYAYFVPANRRQLLDEFFTRMQKKISRKNIERYGAKSEYAIAFAHPFEDGNGRTSRYARRLLAGNIPQASDSATTITRWHEPAAALLNKLAVFDLFKKELSEDDLKDNKIEVPDDVLQYVFCISKSFQDYGFAHALRGLALRKTYPDVGLWALLSSTDYFKGLAKDADAKARYETNYKELQDKLFWKTQELIDKEPDINRLEDSFREHITKLHDARRKRLDSLDL